jgi:hypothetical protein
MIYTHVRNKAGIGIKARWIEVEENAEGLTSNAERRI